MIAIIPILMRSKARYQNSIAIVRRHALMVGDALQAQLAKREGASDLLAGNWDAPTKKGILVVLVTFGLFGGWAYLAPIDSAAIASGSIVLESDRKAVQHLEGGIVSALLVGDDAHVQQGQVLMRLEATRAVAQQKLAQAAVYLALAEEARLAAEADQRDAITYPDELLNNRSDPLASRAMRDQQLQFEKERMAEQTEISILEQQIQQSQQQINGAAAQRQATQAQIESVTEEYNKLKPLADQGIVAVTRVTALKRSRADLQGRLGTFEADVSRFKQIILEARLKIDQVKQMKSEQASAKLAEMRARLSDARQKAKVAADVLSRTEIRAPSTGRVVGLKVHTLGAVIRSGKTLMEIVPDQDHLIVSAKLSPLEINHVHVGLPAEVRLPSFKARTMPIALGTVQSVSADALRDATTQKEYYEIRVSVETARFPNSLRTALKPGMPAEVYVETGERTMLTYLVQPLKDAMSRGMREN